MRVRVRVRVEGEDLARIERCGRAGAWHELRAAVTPTLTLTLTLTP